MAPHHVELPFAVILTNALAGGTRQPEIALWYQTSGGNPPVSPRRAGLGIIAHMGWSVAILGFLAAAVFS